MTERSPDCPNCRARVGHMDRFCESCGHRLSDAVGSAPPDPAPAPAKGSGLRWTIGMGFVALVIFQVIRQMFDLF